jgi:hypothetical protein
MGEQAEQGRLHLLDVCTSNISWSPWTSTGWTVLRRANFSSNCSHRALLSTRLKLVKSLATRLVRAFSPSELIGPYLLCKIANRAALTVGKACGGIWKPFLQITKSSSSATDVGREDFLAAELLEMAGEISKVAGDVGNVADEVRKVAGEPEAPVTDDARKVVGDVADEREAPVANDARKVVGDVAGEREAPEVLTSSGALSWFCLDIATIA